MLTNMRKFEFKDVENVFLNSSAFVGLFHSSGLKLSYFILIEFDKDEVFL